MNPATTDHFDIQARAFVPAAPVDVFTFLSDLENHWLVADRFIEVIDLVGPPGARTGGRVRIRGPLGLHRTAVTQVDFVDAPNEMRGSARIGRRTRADVQWILRPAPCGTRSPSRRAYTTPGHSTGCCSPPADGAGCSGDSSAP